MATKHFVQQFAVDFDGINAECSPIEDEGNEVNRAVNLEVGAPNALRGRVGCQLAAHKATFLNIYGHSYSRTLDKYVPRFLVGSPYTSYTKYTADGATIQELLGLNSMLWAFDTFTMPITYASGGPWTWYATESGGNIHIIIKNNGVSALDYNALTGLEAVGTGFKSYYDFLQNIPAPLTVSYTRTNCPPYAIVNGNQTGAYIGAHTLGSIYRLTVDAGYTFLIGDYLTYFDAGTAAYQGGLIVALTATTLDLVQVYAPQVLDNQILGALGNPAAAFPITTINTNSATPLTLTFPYWRMIPCPIKTVYGRFSTAVATRAGYPLIYKPPTFTSANGNSYFAYTDTPPYQTPLFKYDGQSVYAAGLPRPTITAGGTTGGATIGAGTYRYKAFYRRIDAQGNIIEGEPSPVLTNVLGGAVATQAINIPAITYASNSDYVANSGYVFGNQGPLNFSTNQMLVDNSVAGPASAHCYFNVGDPVCFINTAGALVRSTITSSDYTTTATATRITIADTTAQSVLDNQEVSAGLTAVILRTTAGGNQYYVLGEWPITGYSPTVFIDGIADATLVGYAQYLEEAIGKEFNPPPNCSLVTQHQGLLVVSGNPVQPNTVYFSTANSIEAFPLASNNFDVPSTVTGPVTAIASDTNDRLAVFKDNAYYDVVGDLDAGAFSVNVKYEGDFGIVSQASLARINGTLVGMSRLGIIGIADGTIDSQTFRRINARLINQPYAFRWAVGCNDAFNRQYIVSMPQSLPFPSWPHVTLVIDYSRPKLMTFERDYVAGLAPNGGITMKGDVLFTSCAWGGSVFRRLDRFNANSPTGDDGDSFIDHVSAISYIYESQPHNFGEPEVLKTPIRIRLWSIPNDYIVNGWVPWSVLLQSGPTPISNYIGSGYPGGTTSTVTFLNQLTDWFKDVKLVTSKCHFYIIRLTTNTKRQAPFLSGYEVMYALAYDKEDFVR